MYLHYFVIFQLVLRDPQYELCPGPGLVLVRHWSFPMGVWGTAQAEIKFGAF